MIAFATDEDIALRASSDFMALCPRDQTLVSGTDGSFSSDDRWTLIAPSTDLQRAGLRSGQMVQLTRPASAFGPGGQVLVVHQVSPTGLILRRKGHDFTIGQPPAPASGVTGVEFAVRTLGPQILRAGQDVGRRLGIDEGFSGRRPIDLCDPAELREAVVLTVLYRQFLDLSRQFSGSHNAPDDWYGAKARILKTELDEHLSGLSIRWKTAVTGSGETVRFGTRISR